MNDIIQVINTIVRLGFEKFGKYYSTYRGFVYDNNDPLGIGRIMLVVPNISKDDPIRYWSYPSTYSGLNYGLQILPNKGDLVWVTFEYGDPRRPMWHHGHFGEGDIADNYKGPDKFWFKTPGGSSIEINDTDSSIKIISKGGKVIYINDNISLGKDEVSDYQAVLYQPLSNLLSDLISEISKIKTVDLKTLSPDTIASIEALKGQLNNFKSNSVTLDE